MKRIRMRVWLRVFGSTSVRRTAMRLSAAAAAATTRSAQDYEAMRAGARVVSEIPGVDASMVVVVAGGRLDLHVCQGGTAMGSSVGTSDRAYSKRLFYVSFRSTIHYFGCSTMRTRMCQGGVLDTCPSSIGEASRAVHASREVSASGGSGSQLERRACRRC